MTANFETGYRMFDGSEINTAINAATKGDKGDTGSTGSTGATGAGAPVATPANASATGVAGTWSYDATHIYVCISTNTWVRATTATW